MGSLMGAGKLAQPGRVFKLQTFQRTGLFPLGFRANRMPFQLVIAEGKEAGREFVFDQDSILIGRTDECDVVLYEAGVSRRHARISEEAGAHFVEDQGSSNGTVVNGAKIEGKTQLNEGDLVTLGSMVFRFSATASEGGGATEDVPLEGGAHTRVLSASELKRSRNKGVAGLAKDAAPEEVQQMRRRPTQMLPAALPPSGPTPEARASAPRPSGSRRALSQRPSNPGINNLAVPPAAPPPDEAPPPAPQDASGEAPPPPEPPAPPIDAPPTGQSPVPVDIEAAPTGIRPAPASVAADVPARRAAPALTAAERARLRRSGFKGQVIAWWAEANLPQRIIAAVSVAIIVFGLLGLGGWALFSGGGGAAKGEPKYLTEDAIDDVFGAGEGVNWHVAKTKNFEFSVTKPVNTVAILSFFAKDISSGELEVRLNAGAQVFTVDPDTAESAERPREFVFAAEHVHRDGTPNLVSFENLKATAQQAETWRVWGLQLEYHLVPELAPDALIQLAGEKYEGASRKWEQKDIGAQNLWAAYVGFREAWLNLEGVPDGNKQPTYQLAREKMRAVRKELDTKCAKLRMTARMLATQNSYDQAGASLDQVKDYFPTKQHPCQHLAERDRYELGL